MNPRRILRTGIMASALAHLSALLLLLFFTEVHPFGSVTAEQQNVPFVNSWTVVLGFAHAITSTTDPFKSVDCQIGGSRSTKLALRS